MKDMRSMVFDAQTKCDMWKEISEDSVVLKDRGKTKEQALYLTGYYEGKLDALIEVMGCIINH